MTHCSGKFLVKVNGKWQSFANQGEAQKAENEALREYRKQEQLKHRNPHYKITIRGM